MALYTFPRECNSGNSWEIMQWCGEMPLLCLHENHLLAFRVGEYSKGEENEQSHFLGNHLLWFRQLDLIKKQSPTQHWCTSLPSQPLPLAPWRSTHKPSLSCRRRWRGWENYIEMTFLVKFIFWMHCGYLPHLQTMNVVSSLTFSELAESAAHCWMWPPPHHWSPRWRPGCVKAYPSPSGHW